jgi:hypothetical protein
MENKDDDDDDHEKTTTKQCCTFALELQVGHRMPVALWAFHEKRGDVGKRNMLYVKT